MGFGATPAVDEPGQGSHGSSIEVSLVPRSVCYCKRTEISCSIKARSPLISIKTDGVTILVTLMSDGKLERSTVQPRVTLD